MNILEEVRHITRPRHDEMEAVALSDQIAAGILSLRECQAIILGHYVFHREAEQRLQHHATLTTTQDLGMAPYFFDFHPDIPLDTLPQAPGCMYVMGGATLGGTVVRRALQKVPEITASGAMHHYGCYGGQTGKRWKQFKAVVEGQVTKEAGEREFLDVATSTFWQYTACMQKEQIIEHP